MVDITRIRKKAKKIKTQKKKSEKEEKIDKIELKAKKKDEETTIVQGPSRSEEEKVPDVEPTGSESAGPAELPPIVEKVEEQEAFETEARVEVDTAQTMTIDGILARLFQPVPRSLDYGRISEEGKQAVLVEGKEQFFVFQLQKEWYAIPLTELKEIVRFRPHTRMPGAPDEVLGVMNLRGQMITVINSYQRLGLPSPEIWTLRHRVAMVKDGDDVMGFIIENVGRVAYIDASELLPPLMHVTRERSAFIKNIFHLDGKVVSLLDLPNFLDITREPVRE